EIRKIGLAIGGKWIALAHANEHNGAEMSKAILLARVNVTSEGRVVKLSPGYFRRGPQMRLPVVGPPVPDVGNGDESMGGRIGDGEGRFPHLQPLDCGSHAIGP